MTGSPLANARGSRVFRGSFFPTLWGQEILTLVSPTKVRIDGPAPSAWASLSRLQLVYIGDGLPVSEPRRLPLLSGAGLTLLGWSRPRRGRDAS